MYRGNDIGFRDCTHCLRVALSIHSRLQLRIGLHLHLALLYAEIGITLQALSSIEISSLICLRTGNVFVRLADSTSPFKHRVENLRIAFKLQDLATDSDQINFGTASMNIIAFIHNCTWLKQILKQYATVNAVELDLTALCPFEDDDNSPITDINTSNALQPHSMKSIMTACYRYFLDALLPLHTLVNKEGQRTLISCHIRHPKQGLSVQSVLDEQFLWQGLNGILQFMRQCRVTRMEVEVDDTCSFNWLWWFSRLEYLCLRQSHNSIHDDHTEDCEVIANSLGRFLPYVNISRLSFCGMWSRVYPPNLTTLNFKFDDWPNVDIYPLLSAV